MPQDYLRFGIITRLVARFFYSLILDAPRKELIHRGGAEERKSVCFSLMSAMFTGLNLAKGRARHIPSKLIQWLGLLRNMSCSFSYMLFWQ